MKAIVGLGNPGPEYRDTRHNAGFRVIDELVQREGWSAEREKRSTLGGQTLRYRVAERSREWVAIKPLTFMNASGGAFAAALKDFGIAPADALVILDDADLPLGRIRLRPSGTSGGQKGLEDILRVCGTDQIARLRFGVGAGGRGDLAAHVLADFASEERELLTQSIRRAADAAQLWAERGIDEAMNRFNGSETN